MNLTPDLARIAHEIGNELPNGNRATAFATMYRFNNLTIQRSLSNRFNCQRTQAFPLSAFGGEGWGEVAFIDPTLSGHQPITLNHQPFPSKQQMHNYLTLILNAISSPATAARPSFGARLSPAAARSTTAESSALLRANNNRGLFLRLWRLSSTFRGSAPFGLSK